MKSPFKKKDKQPVQLAANDPARVPVEHRKFINETLKLLQDKGNSNFDTQIVLQTLELSARSSDFVNTLRAALEVGEKYLEITKDKEKTLLATDLQVIVMQINAAFNKMKFGNVELEEI